MTVLYIVALWFGGRRSPHPHYTQDKTCYLKSQLASLQKYKHKCNVLFVVNGSIRREECRLIKKHGFRYIIYNNIGASYGAWLYGWQQNLEFNYYIFVEDDYHPAVDDWDLKLLREYRRGGDSGYLCAYVGKNFGEHAAISNGIVRKGVLESAEKIEWPTQPYSVQNQILFSRIFDNVGGLRQANNVWIPAYWSLNRQYKVFDHTPTAEPLIIPYGWDKP